MIKCGIILRVNSFSFSNPFIDTHSPTAQNVGEILPFLCVFAPFCFFVSGSFMVISATEFQDLCFVCSKGFFRGQGVNHVGGTTSRYTFFACVRETGCRGALPSKLQQSKVTRSLLFPGLLSQEGAVESCSCSLCGSEPSPYINHHNPYINHHNSDTHHHNPYINHHNPYTLTPSHPYTLTL